MKFVRLHRLFARMGSPLTARLARFACIALSLVNISHIHAQTPATTVYAAPGGNGNICTSAAPCSLTGARDFVRAGALSANGDARVVLKSGVYTLSDTFALTEQDSGQNGHTVTYEAETPGGATLSGGVRISNWTDVGNGLFRASVPAGLRFRQLYVGGEPAVRARHPNAGSFFRLRSWDALGRRVEIDPSIIGNWQNLQQIEMVTLRHWNMFRMRLDSISTGPSIDNTALGRPTYPSSAYDAQTQGRNANDGDIDTIWASSATDSGGRFWFTDLGRAEPIRRIEVVTRRDGDYPWSRSNFEVWASNNGDMSKGHVVLGGQGNTPLPIGGTLTIEVTDPTPYQFIAVIKTNGDAAAYAEVRVLRDPVPGGSGFVTPQQPERSVVFGDRNASPPSYGVMNPGPEPNQPYFFENALEFLDSPGEFFLEVSSNTLYYRPRPGENMQSASVVAPTLQHLLRVEGTATNPAQNLAFKGIVFEHADWLKTSEIGFVGLQAGAVYNGDAVEAGVRFNNVKNIRVDSSTFRNMGASGFNVESGARDIAVTRSTFYNLGGQGIALGSRIGSAGAEADVIGATISDNTINRIGQAYFGSVAIFAGYASNVTIEHNLIHDAPYSAISVGWGWSAAVQNTRDNLIRANRIYNVMNLLDDGAGIYTLSNQPGTVIAENYIHNIARSPWAGGSPVAGVYLDEQSGGITVRDNVLLDVPTRINQNRNQPNNTFTNNDGDSPATIANAGPRNTPTAKICPK